MPGLAYYTWALSGIGLLMYDVCCIQCDSEEYEYEDEEEDDAEAGAYEWEYETESEDEVVDKEVARRASLQTVNGVFELCVGRGGSRGPMVQKKFRGTLGYDQT